MTQAWTSGVERTWKSLSEWVNSHSGSTWQCSSIHWQIFRIVCTASKTHTHTHTYKLLLSVGSTVCLTQLALCLIPSWLANSRTYSDCDNKERANLRHQSPSSTCWSVPVHYWHSGETKKQTQSVTSINQCVFNVNFQPFLTGLMWWPCVWL